MKRLAILVATLALALSAVPALATPGVGVVSAPILARGTNQTAQLVSTAANRDVVTTQLTMQPGATTGWHTHPGPVTVVVVAGTQSFWRTPGCEKLTLEAGDSINLSDAAMAPGGGTGLDLARNEGTVPTTLLLTHFNVPVGSTQLLQHVSSTPCTSAPQEFASSTGLVSTPIARGTLAAALNYEVTSGTDILNQTITIAPGGTTGWHSHPGTTIVQVSQGTGTFQHADCTTTTYGTGTAFVDFPREVHQLRNDGAINLVIHATYTNVPAAGVFRFDEAAPRCATAAAAAPAAVALPNTATLGDSAFSLLSVVAMAILLSSSAGFAIAWAERRRRLG